MAGGSRGRASEGNRRGRPRGGGSQPGGTRNYGGQDEHSESDEASESDEDLRMSGSGDEEHAKAEAEFLAHHDKVHADHTTGSNRSRSRTRSESGSEGGWKEVDHTAVEVAESPGKDRVLSDTHSDHSESEESTSTTKSFDRSPKKSKAKKKASNRNNNGFRDRLYTPTLKEKKKALSYGKGEMKGRLWSAKDTGSEVITSEAIATKGNMTLTGNIEPKFKERISRIQAVDSACDRLIKDNMGIFDDGLQRQEIEKSLGPGEEISVMLKCIGFVGTPCIYTDSTGDCLLVFTVLRKKKGESVAGTDGTEEQTSDGSTLIPHRLLFVFQDTFQHLRAQEYESVETAPFFLRCLGLNTSEQAHLKYQSKRVARSAFTTLKCSQQVLGIYCEHHDVAHLEKSTSNADHGTEAFCGGTGLMCILNILQCLLECLGQIFEIIKLIFCNIESGRIQYHLDVNPTTTLREKIEKRFTTQKQGEGMSEITSGVTANYHAIHLHYLDAPTHCIKESIAFIDPTESSAEILHLVSQVSWAANMHFDVTNGARFRRAPTKLKNEVVGIEKTFGTSNFKEHVFGVSADDPPPLFYVVTLLPAIIWAGIFLGWGWWKKELRWAAVGPLMATIVWQLVLATVAKWSPRTRVYLFICSFCGGLAAVGIPIVFYWVFWLFALVVEFRDFWPQYVQDHRPKNVIQVITLVVCSIALNICLLSFGVLFGMHGDAHLPEWAKIAEEDAVAAL